MSRCGLGSLVIVALLLATGCGEKYKVTLRYDRPPQVQIPEKVHSVGIAQFGGKSTMDKRWGDIASDRLAARLHEYNVKYQRYQLVDRKRLKAILDEQDLASAFSDSSQAVQAGKLAKVDAMIYGTVTVTSQDQRGTRTVYNLDGKSRQVAYTQRHVMTAVNFTIDDIATGKTLHTVSLMRDYDSEKGKGGSDDLVNSMVKGLLGGSSTPDATEEVASDLIDQCIDAFLVQISPHEVVVTETLRMGRTEEVETGNKLADAGDYGEAIEAYASALAIEPEDHEAVFNTGVMYEAMGKLSEAEQWYSRAFKMKSEKQYLNARKRVRIEKVNGQ